jgi:arylsulfatase A-like enzyme/tetratricopeptide (TPR) repeat protein
MKRALVVLAAIGLAAVIVVLARRPPSFTIAPEPERNVLLVTIDTLRADAVGSYGGAAATPNLDHLAASGARFAFAHAHAVLTLPSHASILTGRHPYEHGIRDNTGFRMREGAQTLAGMLKAAGFATGAFVSAFTLDQRYGLNAGFDIYDDRVSEVGRVAEVAVPERRADAAVSSALAWIDAQRGKWFGWVHVFDPHAPYAAPPDWAARYPDNAYAGEVAWTDFALGSLLARLDKESRPTLVVVTADHGEGLGEHGELTHGIFAYETTLRVPLIIAEVRPGGPPARGVTIDAAARHIDLMPTILDAVGLGDDDLPGASLAPAIAGDDEDRPAYFESMMPTLARGWAPLRGVIARREKFIDLPIAELFDLDVDPAELQNHAPQRGGRVEVLRNILRGFDLSPPDPPAVEAASARARLRALGYAAGTPVPQRGVYTEADDPKRLIELDRLLHRASEHYLAGRTAEAMATYREILQRRRDTADAYRGLAALLWELGQPAEAIATLDAALRQGAAPRDLQVRLGIYLAESGAAARAIPLLEALPQDDTEVLNALGIAYGQSSRDEDARRAFRRALDLDPTSGLAWQNLGLLQLRAGELGEAEASLRRALGIDPTLAGASTTLGVVLSRTGRRGEAIEAWKRAVDIDPTSLDALYNLTIELSEAGRRDEARAYGQRYLASAPPAADGADRERIRKLIGGT